MLTCVGCASNTDNKNDIQLEKIYADFQNYVYVLVDKNTGVNYLVYNGVYKGGIAPRYNTDGSLYVTK